MASGFACTRAASPSRPRVRSGLLGALLVTALALIVRFSTLTLQSLWLDEAYTDHLVHLGFGAMLSAIPKSESTPPLYYVVTWGWTHLFGFSELALRSVSALAGAATVAVAYALAGRLAGARAGLIAGILLALSPLMVRYSQETRAYALATLLATGTILCLIRYLDTLAGCWLAGWAATAALGLCTHYFVAFVVGPELAWLLWHAGLKGDSAGGPGRSSRRQVQAAVALVALIALALVPLALAQRGTGHADYIAQGSLATRAIQVPKQFLVGYASPGQGITAPLATLILLAGALWPLARHRARIDRATLIPLGVGLSCVLVPLALAIAGIDFLDTRNLLPALPALIVVAAVGLAVPETWPRGGVLAGWLAALLATVVLLVDSNVQYQRADWRGASRALGAAARARAIVVAPGSGLLALQAYEHGLRPLAGSAAVGEIDVVALPAQTTGSGMGAAPRSRSRLPVPAQFHLVAASYARAYTVLRFRASAPVTVTPAQLIPSHLGSGSLGVYVQVPER
ncbi:MAG: glycosyltransferase family 39 protein [Solirubrobacteraceae bacterium]